MVRIPGWCHLDSGVDAPTLTAAMKTDALEALAQLAPMTAVEAYEVFLSRGSPPPGWEMFKSASGLDLRRLHDYGRDWLFVYDNGGPEVLIRSDDQHHH